MFGVMERCRVCSGEILYISPKHIGESKCVCTKYDVHSDPEGQIRIAVIHVHNGQLFLNKFKEGQRIVDGTVERMDATDPFTEEAGKEVDRRMGL